MRIKWDRQYLKYTFYAALTIIIAIAFFHMVDNLSLFVSSIRTAFRWTRRLISPFIIAAFIAYLMNPGVRWFEHRVYGRIPSLINRHRIKRNASIATVFFILASAIIGLVMVVAPQIAANIREIAKRAPEYAAFIENLVQNWSEEISSMRFYNVNVYEYLEPMEKKIVSYFDQAGELLDTMVAMVVNRALIITSGFLNFLLGLVISFYALADKESFKKGIERFLRAFISSERVEGIKQFGRDADLLFSRFIVGKTLDSVIIGILCYIGMSFLNVRYALLLSVVVGVTNMIPYFGPFIGMVPAGFLTLFEGPMKALWVVLFILALQQFDGLYLGPKILGNSVGIPPFWVIFSIVVGGKLFGVMGMFLGVPVFGVIRLFVFRILDQLVAQKEALVPLIMEEDQQDTS
ncbi:AI-2E family transporter [Anoxynatronum sibiricum]|uniref:AI-2E family transporter n=1 Tax=Anoxynatronum sibiricum TaxID=210623 RepID=A0ABU9VWX0_9CLOT